MAVLSSSTETQSLVISGTNKQGCQYGIDDSYIPTCVWRKHTGFNLKEGIPDKRSECTIEALPRCRYKHLINLIQFCGKYKDLHTTRSLHKDALQKKLTPKNIYITTALITTYAKCGALRQSQKLFDELLVRNIVSWNALIAGYAQNCLGVEALNCFRQMQDAGISPDPVTFVCVLKACGSVGALDVGEEIHVGAIKQGMLEKNIVLGNAFVDMYAKCGELGKAQKSFSEMPVRNVITWSALIAGYADHGLGVEALKCFKQMREEGTPPNEVTFISVLKACGSIGILDIGEDIHSDASKQGLIKTDILLGSTLVDMYAKCGKPGKAKEVFDEMPVKNVITWSALITGYVENGLGVETVNCFMQMRDNGVFPDAVTFICIFRVCSSIGALEVGKVIHAEATKQDILVTNTVFGNALVDMYSKCGEVGKAQEVFGNMPIRSVITWSALMAGYAQLGEAKRVLDMSRKMVAEDMVPNLVTFVVMLTACSHAGFVEEGQSVLNDMNMVYHLTPTIEHYTCWVDLLSRAGHFAQAIDLLENVSSSHHLPLFLRLLGACRKWVKVEVGRWAFEQSLQVDKTCADAYVCMGSIYAAASMYAEAAKVEALRMKNTGILFVDQYHQEHA